MTSTYTHSYWASNMLLANANRTLVKGLTNGDNLTEWLKNSYNSNVDTSTDYLDLLAQLKCNNGFNAFNYADNYVVDLENNPMGNMRNDMNGTKIKDNDFYSYTTGPEYLSVQVSTRSGYVYNLPDRYSFATGDCHFISQEDKILFDKITANDPSVQGASVSYYEKDALSIWPYPTVYRFRTKSSTRAASDYSAGVKFDKNGMIAANLGAATSVTLAKQVVDDLAANPTLSYDGKNTLAWNTLKLDKNKLVEAYNNIANELLEIKEYSLTNQEIMDLQKEIDALNGDGVKANYERKIAKAQDELKEVFATQVRRLSYDFNSGAAGVFDQTQIDKAAQRKVIDYNGPVDTAPGAVDLGSGLWSYKGHTYPDGYPILVEHWVAINPSITITAVSIAAEQYQAVGGEYYYNGEWKGSTENISKIESNLNTIFAQKLNGSYDYTNSAFYQYVVGLKTDSSLDMVDSFAEVMTGWSGSKTEIKKGNPGEFDPANYSNVEAKDHKLGPLDVLKELYGTQELIALYKQYEESQTKANSLTISLNVALQTSAEFDYRKALAAALLAQIKTFNEPQLLLDVSNSMNVINNTERGCSTGPSAQKKTTSVIPKFDGFYGDTNKKAVSSSDAEGCLVDPYQLTINGTKYIMGRDGDANGNIDDVSEILGINDSYDNPFTSLISLDSNKDGMVSQAEMLNAGIIFKAVDDNGELTDSSYDTSLVNSIDLSSLKKLQNGNIAGSFSAKLSNGSTALGVQTFDDQEYFNTLFGRLVDLRPYQTKAATATTNQAATTTSKTATTATTVATATNKEVATQSATSITSTKHQNLLNQINSAYSALIIDDTSHIETIMNNVCWKHGISLTSAQRIKIVDGIDPLLSVYEIEKKIINAVSILNLSA